MKTPDTRVSIIPDKTNSIHIENKKKRKYSNNNPPTIKKITCIMRVWSIMEDDMK